ncbi:TetR/AcrR family transcriptional regulator [Pseudomonas hefeiensis]|uniref:TetR/AcrR family transcriptional regulator n=1 Tax=Pseudomonas hefeiensis TaxID=2738125 RepID=UPI0027329BC7|nr:TetR/AcrR family transcriptional regulator [Pseudomonas sp. FP53]WLH97797.1 TetR/AcrR family transcriptional regulator [Pseudomonas sp. FP53]
MDALSAVGFEAVSIADIARRGKTTPPAIYRRFPNKKELLLAALEHDLATVANTDTDQGSLRADLIRWSQSIFNELSPRRTCILASLTFQARIDTEPIELLADIIHRIGTCQWLAILRRAVQREELADKAIPEVIARLPGALAVQAARFHESSQDQHLIVDLIDAVMLPALQAAAPSGIKAELGQLNGIALPTLKKD